jgi:hypothetical protein
MDALLTRQNLKDLAAIYTQGGIAKKVGHSLNQRLISSIIRGERPLTPAQAQAIELEFGIPHGWVRNYPLKKVLPLLRELQKLCPDHKKLTLVHRLLEITLDKKKA